MEEKEKINGLIAGCSLIIMAIAAGFSYGYVYNSLILDTPENTFKNLIENKSLFIAGLSGWSVIFLTDLIVAVSLYFFFRGTSRPISLATGLVRIVYTLILGVAIIQLFKIIPVLSTGNLLTAKVKASAISLNLQMFEKLWSVGLIVFGLHLIGLGYLAVKSKYVHWTLGYFLYLGGISYTLLHGFRQLDLFDAELINSIENILALPMGLSEILLAFWLIYIGFRKSASISYT